MTSALPDPALVVLVGASGSGKSAWAAARYRPQEVVSSDQLRGVQVQVTVLDIPVIGEDRAHAAAIVEKLRGRTPAATFARRHHAGTAADHIGRYRLLAERGVATVFVSLPDLAGPQDVLRLAPVTAAFR